MNQKRVYCLYRVSTVGQVEKDDIPMQRQYCREFIERNPELVLTNELYEKGISGFKVSAKERDAIQEMQRDAVQGKFEILLVYMFDRLGRKDDETPFVVEWFVQNGIEVWSAVEGQQRFDNHVDKLLNYNPLLAGVRRKRQDLCAYQDPPGTAHARGLALPAAAYLTATSWKSVAVSTRKTGRFATW